ncbi:MAG TPA: hypothetical protein VMV46_04145 [Thermoanaerobaculia bacterium]|nr:hypothetical protein [Thermoanaerobaculia bacterium]
MKLPPRTPLWSLAALVLLAAGTAALDRWHESGLPTGSAEWIWTPAAEPGMPLAFVAAVDFEVGTIPETAELRLLVDPEYLVWINGTWIGGGRYRLGQELDVWEVAERLQTGPNRVAIAARSPFGAGGLLAALVADPAAGGGTVLVESDARWRVFDRRIPGVIEGWTLLDGGTAPRVWGRPPIGRWVRPRPGPVRPAELADAAPVWGRSVSPAPRIGSARERDAEWEGGEEEPGGWLVDFGEVATGWIDLWGGPTPDTRVAWRAAESLESLAGAPAGWVVPLRGDELWRSPRPRRLRYLWIDSPQPPRAARILPSGGGVSVETPADDARRARDGLWKLAPPTEPR